jgi:hypothetical protein
LPVTWSLFMVCLLCLRWHRHLIKYDASPVVPAALPGRKKEASSNCPSPTDQLDYQNHQRNDQEDMDVPRNHVETDKADQPKYK